MICFEFAPQRNPGQHSKLLNIEQNGELSNLKVLLVHTAVKDREPESLALLIGHIKILRVKVGTACPGFVGFASRQVTVQVPRT